MSPLTELPKGPFARLGKLVTARPWATLLVALIIGVWSIWSASQLRPATGVQDMLADDQPAAIAFGKTVENFSLIDDLLVMVRLPESAEGGDPQRLIDFAGRLETQLGSVPGVAEVRYRPSAQARAFVEQVAVPRGLFYLDEEQRQAVAERLQPEAMRDQFEQNAAMLAAPGPAASQLAKKLIQDPLRLREFLTDRASGLRAGSSGMKTLDGVDATISADGRTLLMQVTAERPASDLAFTAELMPRIREAVAKAQPDGLKLIYTGGYAIAEYSNQQTRRDLIFSCAGSIGLLLGLFLIVYRNPLTMGVLALPLGLAILAAFGVYVVISGRLTPVTAVSGAVLAGLGIDYCVHYLSHHESERRDRGEASHQRVSVFAVHGVGPAMLAACVTSLIGFGAVLSSGVRSLREFSLLGILGLAFSLLASMTVLPALLCALGNTRMARGGLSLTRVHFAPLVLAIARWRRVSLVISVVTGVVILATVLIGSLTGGDGWHSPLKFDSDLHALHPRPHPALEARDTLADIFGSSPDSLMIHLEAGSTDDLLTLSQQVQARFAQPDMQQLGVAGILGPATLLSDHPRHEPDATGSSLIGGVDPDDVIGDFRAAAEAEGFSAKAFDRYEGFLRVLLTSRPPELADVQPYPELTRMVLPRGTDEPTQGLVLVTLDRPWTTVERRNQIIDEVRVALEATPGATLTGLSVIGYDTQIAIGEDLSLLLWIAAGAVLLWLIVFFRRPSDVILALLPAAFGLFALLAFAEWRGWTLNVINLISLPLILGIGVDDGIFLTAIYRRCRRRQLSRAQLVEQVAASAHAVIMTTLTTGLAFGSLALTSVPAVQSLGAFTAVGVTAALLISLFGLVPLMLGRVR